MLTVQLSLLLLPTIDANDACVARLVTLLEHQKGIEHVHLVRQRTEAELCLHYDPNLVSLAQVERLAHDLGAQVSDRYRHEHIPFVGLLSADSADMISKELQKLPGMVHATVNYAAGLASVAYDSTQLQRTAIERVVHQLGGRMEGEVPSVWAHDRSEPQRAVLDRKNDGDTHPHEGHNHSSAPTFLPHWMQERWTVILVGLAGVFWLIGFAGESLLGMPATLAVTWYVLAYIAGGYDITTHAVPSLLRGRFDTDVLMLAAAAGAALLGEWNEGAFLLVLFALGHAGEHYALDRARNAVNALGQLMPQTAYARRNGQIIEVVLAEVRVGETVVVRPGDRIPVDGTIMRGQSGIDQAPITGESMPVQKAPGESVFAGTVNQDVALDIRVDKLARDTTLSRIMQLVAEAQSQTSPTQQFTQRFTAWFVPVVLGVVTLVAVVPWAVGWMSFAESFYRAMVMLIAASPCALAVGTPAAVLAGIGQAARNGVLIKGGIHLENLGALESMAFDKTGTMTSGRFEVTDICPLQGIHEAELLQTAAAVEQLSNHPLAQAVVRAALVRKLELPVAGELTNLPGYGVRSSIGDDEVLLGNLKLFTERGVDPESTIQPLIAQLVAQGRSIMVVSRNGRLLGVLGLADAPRPGVERTMERLRHLGIKQLVMLTGDNHDVATQIASKTGITDVRADLLPEDKLIAIKQLSQHSKVAMVGDGVNDAPALATATVGIAMGGVGTAVALETADIALMSDDINKLPFAVGLSRASAAIIKQNLWISLGVIAVLLATSVFGLVQMSAAVIFHEGSTIVVVLNALRLLVYRLPVTTTE